MIFICREKSHTRRYPKRKVSLEAHVYAQLRKSKYAIAYSEYAAEYSKVDESRLLALIDFAQQVRNQTIVHVHKLCLIQHDAMNSNTAWGKSRDIPACKHHNGKSPHGTIQSQSIPTAHVERNIAAASDTCSSVSCSAELPLRLDTSRSAQLPRSLLRNPALCLC